MTYLKSRGVSSYQIIEVSAAVTLFIAAVVVGGYFVLQISRTSTPEPVTKIPTSTPSHEQSTASRVAAIGNIAPTSTPEQSDTQKRINSLNNLSSSPAEPATSTSDRIRQLEQLSHSQ
jgi:glycosyltransferase A (GT-A) superfamily protein (DUF2064 family)